jgi:hypothetical protein
MTPSPLPVHVIAQVVYLGLCLEELLADLLKQDAPLLFPFSADLGGVVQGADQSLLICSIRNRR